MKRAAARRGASRDLQPETDAEEEYTDSLVNHELTTATRRVEIGTSSSLLLWVHGDEKRSL
jgi:hypothetical protein